MLGLCFWLPWFWQNLVLIFIFLESVWLVGNGACPTRKKRWRKPRKRYWRRRRLPFHLVLRCRRRPHVSFSCRRRWIRFRSRRNAKAKLRSKRHRFLDGHPLRNDVQFSAPSELDSFCNSVDPLQLHRLLQGFSQQDHIGASQQVVDRMNMLVLEANQQVWNTKLSYHKTPLVWDTGASNGLTPFKSDFLDYMEVDIPVKDISKVNRVVGIGTTMYRFVDSVGETIYIPCLSYHLPSAEIR